MNRPPEPVCAEDAPVTSPPAPRRKRLFLQLAFAAAVGTAMWWLVWSTIGSRYHWLHSLFVPSSIVLAAGLFILRNERHWARPARSLRSLLSEIRSGAAPIEELAKVNGGLMSIVPLIQDLFRDIKQHRIELAQLNEEIRHRVAGRTNALERELGSLRTQATRDGLTGLYNRRMFDALLPKMIERCIREKIDLSVLMIDVDNFKHLNDTLGHAAGDELLRDIAQLIRSGIREADAPFRLGGDEFVVILPNLDPPAATEIAQRLIQFVDALAKPINITIHPSLSIGVAAMSQLTEKNAAELTNLADKRLYEMKATRHRPKRKDAFRASA